MSTRRARSQFREAGPADDVAVARLLVELYRYEVPGMMRGSDRARAVLAERLVAASPRAVRHVLEQDGSVVAMGSVCTTEHPRPSTPARAVLAAPSVLGPVNGLRTIAGAVRAVLSLAGPPAADQAQIHSVVVAARLRGKGWGSLLLQRLEEVALAQGKLSAVLQVVASNRTALGFYERHGYREVPTASPAFPRSLGYPTVLMSKDLRNRIGVRRDDHP